jgi:hypothetical protein
LGYEYPHEHPDHYIGQQYLPSALLGTSFYHPSDQGYEGQIEDRLTRWRKAQREALGITELDDLPDLPQSEIDSIKQRHTRRGSGKT